MEYSARLERQSKELSKTANELRKANDKLTKLSQQKDDFLSQVSHELRTPMTSIRSFSEILKNEETIDSEKLKHFSSIINEESKRLTRLLDEILDLSFLESGRIKLNLVPTTLSDVLGKAISATQQLAEEKDALIISEPKAQNIQLITDPDRLSQVFINLITNSIKYTNSKKPEIKINCIDHEHYLDISVLDNGPGIPETEQELIFEKFSRLNTKPATGGVGLGLPISLEIMQNLGGELRCLPVLSGAEFRINLPKYPIVTNN